MVFQELENTLTDLIGSLKPAPMPPENLVEHELVAFDGTERDNSRWMALVSEKLKIAKTFEIHCWNDETEWIELALQYGTLKESDWQGGTMIAGEVTLEFTKMLLNLPKPADREIYNKMTPFFDVWLDDDFQSCHYGTENYI